MTKSILKNDPFTRFIGKNFESNIKSWKKPYDYITFYNIINQCKPKSIIELGSFLGYSTIMMLNICIDMELNTEILCVDTWLGGADHYINHYDKKDSLFFDFFNMENGISGAFDQFCINIVNKNFQDMVYPFPNTTDNAFVYFEKIGIKSDLIYIDASHEEDNVYRDLNNYYRLLSDSGVIFGHDINWNSVKDAVNKFCKEKSIKFDVNFNKYWVIKK